MCHTNYIKCNALECRGGGFLIIELCLLSPDIHIRSITSQAYRNQQYKFPCFNVNIYIPGIEVVDTFGVIGVLVGPDVTKGIVGEISVKRRLYLCHTNYIRCNALECRGWGGVLLSFEYRNIIIELCRFSPDIHIRSITSQAYRNQQYKFPCFNVNIYIPGIEVVDTFGVIGVLVGPDVAKSIVGEISVKRRLYLCHTNYTKCNALECRGWGVSIIV